VADKRFRFMLMTCKKFFTFSFQANGSITIGFNCVICPQFGHVDK